MKKLALLLVPLALLSACRATSSITEEEKAPVEETTAAFSGAPKEIDRSRSVISFVGKSSIVDHEGMFNDYSAQVTLDDAEPANLEKAAVTAEIDLTTITTDSERLDGHLQKADFFDTAVHSKATFTSTEIINEGGNTYDITGDLTVKGITKSVTLESVTITDDSLTGHLEFPRKEFGVGNDSYGDKLLDETVPVEIKLVFVE